MIAAWEHGDLSGGAAPAESLRGRTVIRMIIGTQLRRLREARGITRKAAGDMIRGSEAKISRLELGRVGYKERDVADLLTFYGVLGEQERAALLGLVRQTNTAGWWHDYGDVLPSWFETYIGLEEAASQIRSYEMQFVHGLFQTADYAREVILLGHPTESDTEIDRRVHLRTVRQGFLTRPGAPVLWSVVDESALRRVMGGPAVMRAQLRRLIELAELPNVTLQVVSFHNGGHAAAGGPFTILRFPQPELPDVVYLEQLTSALYLDKRKDVEHYTAVMDRVCVEAEAPTATVDFLNKLVKEL